MTSRQAERLLITGASIFALQGSDLLSQTPDQVARARAIHERVMTLDTHVDINPANFTPTRSYATKLPTQVNLPNMEAGGLDAVFLIVYVGQTADMTDIGYAKAKAQALEKFDAIDRLVNELASAGVFVNEAMIRQHLVRTGGKSPQPLP